MHTLHITTPTSTIRARITEHKRVTPTAFSVTFTASEWLPMGTYEAEWREGDRAATGTLAVLTVRVAGNDYVYGGSWRKGE